MLSLSRAHNHFIFSRPAERPIHMPVRRVVAGAALCAVLITAVTATSSPLSFLPPLHGLDNNVVTVTVNNVFTIPWTVGAGPTDNLQLTILTCPSANISASYCTPVETHSNVSDNGQFPWSVPPTLRDDGTLYRVLLRSIARGTASSSCTIVVAPFLRHVTSRYD